MPLLELIGPRDQFRDDVIHVLHLVQNMWLDGFRMTGACPWDCGSDGVIVQILFETPQHLGRDLDVSRSGCLHKNRSKGESSDPDATSRSSGGWATFVHSTRRQPLSLPRLFGRDRVRPRITESEPRRCVLGCELGGCLDDGSQRVSDEPGVFTVGMVDAPELVARFRHENVVRFHAAIKADAARTVVPIAHNVLLSLILRLRQSCYMTTAFARPSGTLVVGSLRKASQSVRWFPRADAIAPIANRVGGAPRRSPHGRQRRRFACRCIRLAVWHPPSRQ